MSGCDPCGRIVHFSGYSIVKLKVGLVARCLNTSHIRGMGRYVYELLRQSQARDDLAWHLFGDDPRYPMTMPESHRISADVFTFRGDRFHLWEQVGLPLRAAMRAVDLLHCTEGTLPFWQTRPTVATVHDTLAWKEHDGGRVATTYFDSVLPGALRKCAAVITISQSSRNDILEKWPWLDEKLDVIPHGIADEYFADLDDRMPALLATAISGGPYLVYLGGPMERKRFGWALDVYARLGDSGLKMVVCGFGSEARASAEAALPIALKDSVIFAPFLSEGELRALLKGAGAVLYPTLYEGFGFPAIEAQASGVPVIFSSLGSLAELEGPLSMVVPPFDIDAWVAAVRESLALGESLVAKASAAKAWARKFSWLESYEKHLAVYQRVANSGGGK